jgi:Luciferase
MSVAGAQRVITESVSGWDGVTQGPHRFGGLEFRVGRIEIGHVHGDQLVDIPFPRTVRAALVAAGEAEAHHVLPASGWVSVFLRQSDDVGRAIRLLKQAYDRAAARGP